jgi:AraC-like DNA-binding protein
VRNVTHIRSHDDGRDRWRIIEAAPDPILAADVRAYGWWSEETSTFDTRRELAGTAGTLIVNLASDLEIIDADGNAIRLGIGEGFIAGLTTGNCLSRSTGSMAGVHLRAPLSTLARMAGTSIAALTDRIVPLTDLPGLRHARLGERLVDAQGDEARWAVLDGIVEERLTHSAAPCPSIQRIARGLASGVRVEALAEELDWSRKRLARTFAQATGLQPRAFSGLARFERFARQLQAQPAMALAEAAIAAGYADQAHLTREVVRYAGSTPAALRRQLLPDGGGVRD